MGRYLASHFASSGISYVTTSREQLNVCDPEASLIYLDQENPSHVINAAALCQMEQCENDPERSLDINVQAPAWWATHCQKRGIYFTHLSTDYVFNGQQDHPYTEEDKPQPLSLYAQHKYQAEQEVLKYPNHTVVRLAWIFGFEGKTFMSRLPHLIEKNQTLDVATGRVGSCLYAGYGAECMTQLMAKNVAGLYHLTHREPVTWWDYAQECKRQMTERGISIQNEQMLEVPMAQLSTLQALRPAYSVLCTKKLEGLLHQNMLPWQKGLSFYLDELFR